MVLRNAGLIFATAPAIGLIEAAFRTATLAPVARRHPSRCAITVSGFTMIKADRQPVHNLESQTHKRRSVARKRTRWPLVERCRTRSWWRRARISACRPARVRRQAGADKSRKTKRVNVALAAYTPRLCKFNRFNKNGLFSRDTPPRANKRACRKGGENRSNSRSLRGNDLS